MNILVLLAGLGAAGYLMSSAGKASAATGGAPSNLPPEFQGKFPATQSRQTAPSGNVYDVNLYAPENGETYAVAYLAKTTSPIVIPSPPPFVGFYQNKSTGARRLYATSASGSSATAQALRTLMVNDFKLGGEG